MKAGSKVPPREWKGHMEADYIYTSGVAGDRFFKELRESGKLMATECFRCRIDYVPPRMYCEKCFEELTVWKSFAPEGTVSTFTIARIDERNEKLPKPRIWAFIRIGSGGLVHNLGEVEPEKVSIGLKVEAVLKPREQRKGEITDILYFRPKK